MSPRPAGAAAGTGAGDEPAPAVFDVTRSLTGKAWRARDYDQRIAAAIADHHDLPALIGRVLAARGVAIADVPAFLTPTLREALPDPSVLMDMDRAAARITDAVMASERIGIIADYDVDGAASAALMARYLRVLGREVDVHIPDRIREGYGPGRAALAALAGAGAGLILTLDCGIAAADNFEEVTGRADVVVLDHHQPGAELPRVAAVVNPNRQDDASGLGHLCAAGVVFMALIAITRELRRRGAFNGRDEPDLLGLLPLVALATVCDVVPLTGLNRAFVAQGLKLFGATGIAGISALADAARLTGPATVYHLGFMFGPRINAGGRIGRSDLGYLLLAGEDGDECAAISSQLDRLNTERQAIEAAATEEACAMVAPDDPPAVVVVASPRWHPGVVGLVAARLKERFNRPSIAIALDGEGTGRGSGRSIAGVDLGTAVRGAVEAGIAERGGGHAMAAGLTIGADAVPALGEFLERALGEAVRARIGVEALSIDAPLSAGGAGEALMALIDRAGPYGQGHPAPRFAFASHVVAHAKVVGHGHVRTSLRGGDGARLDAIAFRVAGTPLGDALLASGQPTLHIAGRLTRDHYQGRETIRLMIEDAAFPR